MKRTRRAMTYNRNKERWVIYFDGQPYGVQCGDWLELRLGDTAIPCRMEMDHDHDWYIVIKGTRFILYKRDIYEVEI